jgi:hypothetical protein
MVQMCVIQLLLDETMVILLTEYVYQNLLLLLVLVVDDDEVVLEWMIVQTEINLQASMTELVNEIYLL